MLTHRVPWPADRGDRIRSAHLMRELSKYADISLACVSDEPVGKDQIEAIKRYTVRHSVKRITRSYSRLRALASLSVGGAITPAYHYRRSLLNTIKQWNREHPFSIVFTYCTGMIDYSRKLLGRTSPGRPRHVLDLVDVDSMKWQSLAKHAEWPMKWVYTTEARRLRGIESCRRFPVTHVLVVSEREARAYHNNVREFMPLQIVGNGVDTEVFEPQPDCSRPRLIFTGAMNYSPNVDAMLWFVERVWPTLQQRIPGITLTIVGRDPINKITQLEERPGVRVTGKVPDIRPYMREAAIAIAPLRMARGVQNKVLQAMSCQRAVICSHDAALGLEAVEGEHLLVAGKPAQWVDQIVELLNNDELRQRLAANARKLVEDTYAWDQRLRPLVQLLMGPLAVANVSSEAGPNPSADANMENRGMSGTPNGDDTAGSPDEDAGVSA